MMVLGDPLHFMYTKVNKFLNKSPKWNPRKLPSYWIDKVLLHPPTEDESHYREVEWVLDALMEGLRTAQVCQHRGLGRDTFALMILILGHGLLPQM